MPRLVSPDGDVLNLTPTEYEFLRSVHHELTEARQRGQDPVVCLFFEARKRPAGTVFVPPPESAQFLPHRTPDPGDIARPMPAESKNGQADAPANIQVDDLDEEEDDLEALDDDVDETTATDDSILQVLGDTTKPLKRVTIAHRGDIKNSSYFAKRLKILCDAGKVRHLRGHFYWLAGRPLPPQQRE